MKINLNNGNLIEMNSNLSIKCPHCGSSISELIYPDIRDIEDATPGTFDIVKCGSCDLAYLGRESSAISLSSLYSRSYHAYEKKNAYSFYGALLACRIFLRLNQIPKSVLSEKSIGLEIGCGRGALLLSLAAKFPSGFFWGIEINPPIISSDSTNIKIVKSVAELEIQDSSLDFVMLYEVIEHLPDPINTLEYIFKKLRPGGYLIGSTPRFRSFWSHFFGVYWAGLQIPRHRVFFTDETLIRELIERGFTIEKLRSEFDPGEVPVSVLNWIYKKSQNGAEPRSRFIYILFVFTWAPFQFILNLFGLPSGTIGFLARKPLCAIEAPK